MKSRQLIRFTVATFAVLGLLTGCANEEKKDRDFFTSGSREADQRAEQRVAKVQQLRGEGENNSGGKGPGAAEVKKSLYARLGGQEGITMMVDDFVTRAMADPRVNWTRKGVKRSAFSFSKTRSVEWKPTDQDIAQLKKHIVQFIALSTGGDPHYDGRGMKESHSGLQITNAEFDAAVGDLKATLDKFQIPTEEQKELLAVIESTRTQVVEER